MKLERHGGLDVRLTGGTDGHGGGDGPLVVLCHGFGAPGDDLVAFGSVLPVAAGTRFAFPAAPLALPPMFGDGRAWWMIDLVRIQRALERGEARELKREDPPAMADARGKLVQAVGALARGAPVVLGGFSQGAMLACDLALRDAIPLAGLILLSGTFLAEDAWTPKMAGRAGLPTFQSHGHEDPLLPFAVAEELHRALAAAGLATEFHPFRGGHEIPPKVLAALAAFLGRTLG
jgi:phospholipase/carboxylesterase